MAAKDEKDYGDEMGEMSADMSRLGEEEKKLAKRGKLETMRQELVAKRERVSDIKGTKDRKSKKM